MEGCIGLNTFQDLSRFSLPLGFRKRNPVVVQLWWLVQASLFRCSPQFLYGWRRFLLRSFGARIGKNVLVRPTARVQFPWNLVIGDWSWIGDDVVLYNLAQIWIGEHVVVSQRSYICSGSHDWKREDFAITASPVSIKREAWVAADCFVGPGVTIGEGTVIGARSSVLHDMPPGMICFGSPAIPIKTRKAEQQLE